MKSPLASALPRAYSGRVKTGTAIACICLLAGCGGCAPNGRVVDEMEKRHWAAVAAQTNAAMTNAACAAEETE